MNRQPTAHRAGQRGQMVVVCALPLVAIVSVAAMLLDGGMAWATRRQAQNAADPAAIAAARAIGHGTSADTAAASISGTNGFPSSAVNCSGASTSGVTVHNP